MRSGSAFRHEGFAYVLLLIVLAVVGIVSAASVTLGAAMTRQAAEDELLVIGAEYERALASYRKGKAPGQLNRSPKSFADLLRDPRFPGTKRHLRKIYADPLTGRMDWGLVRAADGSIAGIYSLADGVPINRGGFQAQWLRFTDAKGYADWVFGLDELPLASKSGPPGFAGGREKSVPG